MPFSPIASKKNPVPVTRIEKILAAMVPALV